MYAKLRPRRSTTDEWNSVDPILLEGELGIEYPNTGIGTGFCKFKLGDGITKWTELPYAFDAQAASSIYGGSVSGGHSDICLRSGSTDEWTAEDPILKVGEIVFDSTLYAFKCGDGEHAFSKLDYIGYIWEMEQDYNFGDLEEEDIDPVHPDDKDFDFGDLDDPNIIE